MESFIRKCLNQREKDFNETIYPNWFDEFYMNRIKSVEKKNEWKLLSINHSLIETNKNPFETDLIDHFQLNSFKINQRIPIFDKDKIKLNLSNQEQEQEQDDQPSLVFTQENNNLIYDYQSFSSFLDHEIQHHFQYLSSPLIKQTLFILKQFLGKIKKSIQIDQIENVKKSIDQCFIDNCEQSIIPLSSFCKYHIGENDSKQILFHSFSNNNENDQSVIQFDHKLVFLFHNL